MERIERSLNNVGNTSHELKFLKRANLTKLHSVQKHIKRKHTWVIIHSLLLDTCSCNILPSDTRKKSLGIAQSQWNFYLLSIKIIAALTNFDFSFHQNVQPVDVTRNSFTTTRTTCVTALPMTFPLTANPLLREIGFATLTRIPIWSETAKCGVGTYLSSRYHLLWVLFA